MTPVPFFSIVMPVYNGADYVSGAIESILDQSDWSWELIIVDDASTDRTPEILHDYAQKDPRIRVFRNHKNMNIATSLNRGIREARGNLIVRIDADDFFNPPYLEVLREYAERLLPANFFFSAWVTVVDEGGKKILDVRLPKSEKIRSMMKIENFIYHPATSFPKQLWEKVGGYPEKQSAVAEDTALWNLFFKADAKLVMIPQFLINYRIHYSNITSVNDAQLTGEAGRTEWRTIRQNREWRASLYLKQKMLKSARAEILMLSRDQKRLSLKNIQYFILTFLPESFVYFFMWELRPRARAFFKNLQAKPVRI